MSERKAFLIRYMSGILGRSLTKAEEDRVVPPMTRREARDLAMSFGKVSKKSSSKKQAEMTKDEIVKVVVDEVEGGSGKGSA